MTSAVPFRSTVSKPGPDSPPSARSCAAMSSTVGRPLSSIRRWGGTRRSRSVHNWRWMTASSTLGCRRMRRSVSKVFKMRTCDMPAVCQRQPTHRSDAWIFWSVDPGRPSGSVRFCPPPLRNGCRRPWARRPEPHCCTNTPLRRRRHQQQHQASPPPRVRLRQRCLRPNERRSPIRHATRWQIDRCCVWEGCGHGHK